MKWFNNYCTLACGGGGLTADSNLNTKLLEDIDFIKFIKSNKVLNVDYKIYKLNCGKMAY